MALAGVDVSNNNGVIDWAKVAADRLHPGFALVKASEGLTYRDAYYERNRRGAKRAGLAVGAYHYAHPINDPVAEAEHFLSVAQPKPGELRPALDLEVRDLGSGAQVRRYALAWLRYVAARVGVRPFLYTYPAFATEVELERSPELARFPLWIANYEVERPTIPKPWRSAVVWQYSSSARVAGVSGSCDVNRLLAPSDPLHAWRLPTLD